MTSLLSISRVLFLVVTLGVVAAAVAGDQSIAPPPVPGFPIGRCVQVLGVTTPEEAKTVGYEYLELALQALLPLSDEEFAHTAARLKAIGLPAISGYGFLPADLKIVGPEVNQTRTDGELRHALSRAQQLGLKMVVHGNLLAKGRSYPADFSRDVAWKQLVDFGRRAAREGERRGITVLIEPMPATSTNLINTVADGLALVEAVDHANFQLLVDYSHVVDGKEDLAVVAKAARHIRQIEIQNPNGWVYPRRADEADYAGFFRALKAGGYRGGFSIHGKPENVFVDGPRAIALLRTLAAAELVPAAGR